MYSDMHVWSVYVYDRVAGGCRLICHAPELSGGIMIGPGVTDIFGLGASWGEGGGGGYLLVASFRDSKSVKPPSK